jgi:hypothetical protein
VHWCIVLLKICIALVNKKCVFYYCISPWMDTNNEWLQLTGYKSKQAVIHSSEVYTSLQSMCVCVCTTHGCHMRFQVLTAASIKMTALWNVAPCSLVEVDWCFRGAYCLIALMEVVRTSETSVYFNESAWHCIQKAVMLPDLDVYDIYLWRTWNRKLFK